MEFLEMRLVRAPTVSQPHNCSHSSLSTLGSSHHPTSPSRHSSLSSPNMLCHRLPLQRCAHTLRPSLAPLSRAPLRALPSKPTPLLRLTRAYSQAPKSTIASNNLPPKSPRAAAQSLYPPPDKTKKYRT